MVKRIIIAAVAIVATTASLNAQSEHNDSLRTKTFSIYVQGGVGGFHGMHGKDNQYDRDLSMLAPVLDAGLAFYPIPWFRLALEGGYTYLQSADNYVLNRTTTTPDVFREGYYGTLTVDEARLQNRNFTQVASADLTLGINLIEIWHHRQRQWFNIWIFGGAGYMHGWNRHTSTWAIEENLVSKGSSHMNVYNHSYVKSEANAYQFNTLYIPVGASIEFDVIPQLTLGVYGRYKYFPLMQEHTATGMWSAGGLIRFNIVGRKQGFRSKTEKIDDLQRLLKEQERRNAELKKMNEDLAQDNTRLASDLADCSKKVPIPDVEFNESGLVETDIPLGSFGVQIMAFRIYQHSSNDKIFHGDLPIIYRNGGLRRYVIFTDTIGQAKAKLREVQGRYPDAFIVTIDKDGTVRPYRQSR